MSHPIARLLFEPLLRLLLPGTGRRRYAPGEPSREGSDITHVSAPTARRADTRPLRGEDNALVRPYLVAHERRSRTQRQRARRRALWLAVHGIDVGPRVIHGVEVAG